MSFGIVRVQKMGGGSVKGIEIHDKREKEGVSHTNKDIDWTKVKLNYDLCDKQNDNFTKAVKERITELNLPKAVRKDAVVMAQVLVTSDNSFFKGLSQGQQEQFFSDSYNFLADRYGKENVISATVHLDETTPHMHFNFVPVTADGRLSAKSILTRQSLIEQQTAFNLHVGKAYGLERGIQGGQKKHLEVAELKELTATENAQRAIENAQRAIENAQRATEKTVTLTQACEALEGKIERLEGITIELVPQPAYAKTKKTIFNRKEVVEIPLDYYQSEKLKLINTKIKLSDVEKKLEQVRQEKNSAVRDCSRTETQLEKLKAEKKIIFDRLNENKNILERLEKKNKSLKNDLSVTKQVLEDYPSISAEVEQAVDVSKKYLYAEVDEIIFNQLVEKDLDFIYKQLNKKFMIKFIEEDKCDFEKIIKPVSQKVKGYSL